MPKIQFEASEFGPAVSTEVTGPTPLVDVCDEVGAPILFSCRSASCGTCRVEILAGSELLEEPKRAELEVLDIFAAPPNYRLACQAVVRQAPGVLKLKMAPDA